MGTSHKAIIESLFLSNRTLCAQNLSSSEIINCTDVTSIPTVNILLNTAIVPNTTSIPDVTNISSVTATSLSRPPVDIWTPDVIQRVASLAFIMTLTLVGNTVILVVLTCSRYRKRSSRVNIFILNLAVGDLAVCLCTMTTEILFVAFGQWVLGPVACKILTYLQIVTLASTTFILTSMSFDRYLAICKPLKYRATTSRAKKFIALSWALAFLVALPQLFIFVQVYEEDLVLCRSKGYTDSWQRKLYFSFLTSYILLIPVGLITFCYSSIVCVVSRVGRDVQQQASAFSSAGAGLRRSVVDNSTFPRAKIKTLKMTFAIIATFVTCWTPYFVTTLIRIYSDYKVQIPQSVMVFAETVALLQSGLNPLLYGCFTVKIRRGLADVFCPHKQGQAPRWLPSYNKSATECYSMTEDAVNGNLQLHHHHHHHHHHYNHHSGGESGTAVGGHSPYPPGRLRESASAGSNNSSCGSAAECKARVITEENKNGVRLRVRFAVPPLKDPGGGAGASGSLSVGGASSACCSAPNGGGSATVALLPKYPDLALGGEGEGEDGKAEELVGAKHSGLKHPTGAHYQ